jgi:hypothetical protein
MKTFLEWLKLREEGGLFGNPGTPYPDGLTPTTSKKLGPNKGKLDNSGMSGGPGRKSAGGMPAAGGAPIPPAGGNTPAPPK